MVTTLKMRMQSRIRAIIDIITTRDIYAVVNVEIIPLLLDLLMEYFKR